MKDINNINTANILCTACNVGYFNSNFAYHFFKTICKNIYCKFKVHCKIYIKTRETLN